MQEQDKHINEDMNETIHDPVNGTNDDPVSAVFHEAADVNSDINESHGADINIHGSPAKSSHRKLTLALICLALVLLALGGFLMTKLLRHPLKKAVAAAESTCETIEKSALGTSVSNLFDHGSLLIRADITEMQDLISSLLPLPVKLEASGEIGFYSQKGSLALKAGVQYKGKSLLDGLIIYNEGKELAVSSEAFFGKTNYGINLKNFGSNLAGSAFDPAGGGPYAMPQNLFERLKLLSFPENEFRNLLSERNKLLESLKSQGVDYLIDHAEFSSASQTISLGGESIKTNALTMTMNEETLCGLLKEMIRICRKDKGMSAFLVKALDKLGLIWSTDSPEVLKDQLLEKLGGMEKQLPQLQERLKDTRFTAIFYTLSGRLIRTDLKASKEGKEVFLSAAIGPDPGQPKEISLDFHGLNDAVFSANYAVTARTEQQYSSKLTLRSNATDAAYVNINWNKESGAMTLVVEDLQGQRSISLKAKMLKEGKLTTLALEELAVTENTATQEIPLKGLYLELNEDAQFPSLSNYTEITSMNAEQIQAVFEDLEKTFSGLFSGIFGSLLSP